MCHDKPTCGVISVHLYMVMILIVIVLEQNNIYSLCTFRFVQANLLNFR